jgi:hypothetical protein
MVEDEREKAAGRARVARDTLNSGEIEMQEHEQKALADQALEDFALKEGLVLEAPRNTVTIEKAPPKSLGPKEE